MTILDYTLVSAQRVSAGRRAEVGNERDIHTVIPGSVIRGALAAVWLSEQGLGRADERFISMFERCTTVRQAIPHQPYRARLQPMSELRCKYPSPACDSAAVHDLAADFFQDPPTVRAACPGCGEDGEPGRGWTWRPPPGAPVAVVSATRTELTDDETARQENLFTRRAVERATTFTGSVIVDKDCPTEFVDWLLASRTVRVGGQRSIMGAMRWSAEVGPEPVDGAVGGVAVLRLCSPAILVDDRGAATVDPRPALRRAFGGAPRLERIWSRTARVSGWHAASGLPKPDEWAAEAGSTYIVSGVPETGSALVGRGIGLRRREGYGQVALLAPDELPTWSSSPATASRAVADIARHAEPPANELDRLLNLVPFRDRPRVLPGLRASVRRIGEARDAHRPSDEIDRLVEHQLVLPWARGLHADAAQLLRAILTSSDHRSWQARIDHAARAKGAR